MTNQGKKRELQKLRSFMALQKGDMSKAMLIELSALVDLLTNKYELAKGEKGDPGPKGRDADEERIIQGVLARIKIPVPKDGHTPTTEELTRLILPLIPKVRDGKDVDTEEVVWRVLRRLPTPQDGKPGRDADEKKIIDALWEKIRKNLPTQVREVPQIVFGGGGASKLVVLDEGTPLGEAIRKINFVGSGVSATRAGDGSVVVTISGGGTASNYADNETPTGTINGSNKEFTLAHTPDPVASLSLFLNGAYQTPGGEDFTLSGDTITFVNAPLTGGILRAFYRY